MHLGNHIKFLRTLKGITQQELAESIHKTRPLISSIEQTGNVNELTLRKICNVLEVDMQDLLQKANDASTHYAPIMKANDEVLLENKSLKEENIRLKELVDSQREVIELLKEKYKSK
jgi:transcriptional regulator with XRE-family HTH domain